MDPAHLNKLFSISNWLFLIPCYCQNSIGDLWNTLVPTCCSYDMYTWWCMTYIRCYCWIILYMHVVWFWMWRCSVYFLDIYIIRVFYRFNRSRALHLCPPHVIIHHMIAAAKDTQEPLLALWHDAHCNALFI